MAFDEFARQINLSKREFSLLRVSPNKVFLAWLEDHKRRTGQEGIRLHAPEEDAVVVIPPVARFSRTGALASFLQMLKPRLLSAELSRFGTTGEEFGHPMTAETFDCFFDVSVRDSVVLLTDFG